MFIFYVIKFATSIYREIQENSSKTTINIQFRLKILILKVLFWKAVVTVGYVKAHNLIAF